MKDFRRLLSGTKTCSGPSVRIDQDYEDLSSYNPTYHGTLKPLNEYFMVKRLKLEIRPGVKFYYDYEVNREVTDQMTEINTHVCLYKVIDEFRYYLRGQRLKLIIDPKNLRTCYLWTLRTYLIVHQSK